MSAKTISRCLLRCAQSLHPLLVVAAVSVLFASCTRHSAVWPRLLEVEALLETDPHAAGAMIDSIDATPLTGEDAALYAILKTQADYKLYHPLTSDSLPRLATDYYGTPYRKNYHAAMAWYTLGCYYSEKKDDAGAVEVYLRAKDLFPDTLSRYHALCYQNIGKHLNLHNMPRAALPYLKAFRSHPACMADSSLMSNADYFLGMSYLLSSEFDRAEESFYAVLRNPYTSENDALDVIFQLSKLIYSDTGNCGSSLALIDKYVAECHSTQHLGALWLVKGDIYYKYNALDSALIYYKRAISEAYDIYTQCNAYKQLLNIATNVDETDSIRSYSEHYTSLLNSIFEQTNPDEINEVKAKHDEEMHSIRSCNTFGRTVIVVLAVLSALLMLYEIMKKRKNRPASALFNEESQSSLPQKLALVEQCKENFFRCPAADLLPSDLRFEEALEVKDKEALESALHASFAKVEDSLCNDCVNMTPDDALTCVFYLLGMTAKNIAACSKFTDNSISSRKNRLHTKLTHEWHIIVFGTDE